VEKLAHNLSEKIAEKLGYDQDKKEVIAYGLTAIFQMVGIFSIASFIGIVGGFWYESMVLFLAVGLFRKSTGGAHSSTFQGCIIISIFSISFFAFLSRYLFYVNVPPHVFFISVLSVIYIFSFLVVYKLAPVASPNKPIVRKEKIKKLKIKSLATVVFYYLISMIFIFCSQDNSHIRLIHISLSLACATLWQVFTLTKTGHKLIHIMDSKLT
jgi:accessory gene regulator B